MEIKVGTLDVLHSGSFMMEKGKPFEFRIPDTENTALTLIFYILEDSKEQDYSIKSRLIDERSMEMNLVNFKTGGGAVAPLKIGSMFNRALYFSFYFSADKLIMPVFTYTFYLGEKEVGGE